MESSELKFKYSKERLENSAPNESVTLKTPLLKKPYLEGILSNRGPKKSQKSKKSSGYKSHDSVVLSLSNVKRRGEASAALCENPL